MAAQPQSGENFVGLPPLARALTMAGKLDSNVAANLAKKASDAKHSFVHELVTSGTIKAKDLAHILSSTFAMPLLDIAAFDPNKLLSGVIDPKLISTYKVVGLSKRANKLFIATADPTDQEALDKIKFQTQLAVEPILVEYDKLLTIADKASKTAAELLSGSSGSDEFDFDVQDDAGAQEIEDVNSGADVDDAPVVKFLHKMLIDAINQRASDLHFEPYEFFYRVRFRVDGEMREIAQPPLAIKDKLASDRKSVV